MKNAIYMKIVTLFGLIFIVAFLTGCTNPISQADLDDLQTKLDTNKKNKKHL